MPTWVPLACYTAIAAGNPVAVGKSLRRWAERSKVTPFEGVAAETAGAITLFFTEGLKFPWKIGGEVIKGIPVGTTHTIAGSIIGVGATKTTVGGTLGRYHQPRLGLDPDHSGVPPYWLLFS